MSSILKALKKLDKEPTPGIEVGSLATTLDPTKIFKKSPKDRRPFRSVYLVLQVLIITAGVILFGRYLLDNEQAEQPGLPGQDIDIIKEENATRNSGAHGVSVRTLPMKGESVPGSGPSAHITTTESGRNDTDRTREEAEINNSATRVEINPAINVPPVGVTTAVSPPLLPRLDYSILRLQAVTWAVDPQDRFALIDDVILRKGDSIKGFVVDSIQEDHIVVGKGGEKWRVEFRLR